MKEMSVKQKKRNLEKNPPKSKRGTRVVIVLCVTGLLRVVLLMAPLVGFNWVVNTQENPVQNNQDKPQNQSVVPAK